MVKFTDSTLLIWLAVMPLHLPTIGSLSLKPTTEEILSRDLCPDPVSSQNPNFPGKTYTSSRIMTVSLRPKEMTKPYYSRFQPCVFTEDNPGGAALGAVHAQENFNATIVKIRSINLSTVPWNFSGSRECQKFIMMKSWAEYGSGYPIICGRDNFDQGDVIQPIILYYHLTNKGLIFPLLHPNYGQKGLDLDQKDKLELKYMLFYFSTLSSNGVLTCRLQQYFLEGCPPSYKNQPICGEYNCSDLDTLYQKKMGVRDGEFHQQNFIVVQTKSQERFRMRSFIRQKLVPMIFLFVVIFAYKSYMKAGLKLNDTLSSLPVTEMRSRRCHRRSQYWRSYSENTDHFHDIYFEYGRDQNIPNIHIPYEPSTGSESSLDSQTDTRQEDYPLGQRKYLGNESTDPPPSYDSLFPHYDPPSYTTQSETAPPRSPRI